MQVARRYAHLDLPHLSGHSPIVYGLGSDGVPPTRLDLLCKRLYDGQLNQFIRLLFSESCSI